MPSFLGPEACCFAFGNRQHLKSISYSVTIVFQTAAFVSLVFSTVQCVLEFHNDLDLDFYVESGRFKLFGHGGSLFWMISSLMFASLYATFLALPALPCKKYLSLPNKKSFYYYVGFMAILNGYVRIEYTAAAIWLLKLLRFIAAVS